MRKRESKGKHMSQRTFNLVKENACTAQCLGQTFSNEEARREHYLKLLAQKLKDPEFRKIEGFPIGKDEDILALSDPPYYTACPNPWLAEFIKTYGTPYNPKQPYHREPFAADVSEGRSGLFYDAHTYHTKVPHSAIMRYMLHYTEPGDLVYDGYCGTGMTGVAAQLCGDRNAVQSLGYRVRDDGVILNEEGKAVSRLGLRKVILGDLSPIASFIAHNYNSTIDVSAFERTANQFFKDAEESIGWAYTTLHNASISETKAAANAIRNCTSIDACKELLSSPVSITTQLGLTDSKLTFGVVNFIIWSDVLGCPECGGEIVFLRDGVDLKSGIVHEAFRCPSCKALLRKRNLSRVFSTTIDAALGQTVRLSKQVPLLVNYTTPQSRHEVVASEFDLALSDKLNTLNHDMWFPKERMPEGDESRRNDSAGITNVHQYYTGRNLTALAYLYSKAGTNLAFGRLLRFCITSYDLAHSTKMTRIIFKQGKKPVLTGNQSGTLYISSLPIEKNVLQGIRKQKYPTILESVKHILGTNVVTTECASLGYDVENCLDYIFIDPPFGGNLMYSELNFIWESWLRVFTNMPRDAVTNKTSGKGVHEYQQLMLQGFRKCYKLLKPGRWITIEFSNTQASIWNAIQTTLQEAGFVVANVAALDKQQGSFKAVTTTTAVKQDLVISAYKPNGGLEERFAKRGETTEGVWDFIRTHLKNLPVVKAKGGQLEFIAERDPRILYDRMVAFYVVHSTPVPLSSAEFQVGLAENFPERDGMCFLPEQVNEYDKKRAQVENIGQLTIFVEDERSAINWLRNFLKDRPSTSQDIHTDFMQQLSASWKKWEARPEMSALLDQNFLCYDGAGEVPSQIHGYLSHAFKELRNLAKDHAQLKAKAKNRWYVPDPKKNVDVETLRNKRLLEEFWTYLPDGYTPPTLTGNKGKTLPGLAVPRPKIPKGKKLKELRTEAVRVGFKHCYQQKDYQTILVVAEMIPDSVLNEDEQLQMIYDTAVTRSGAGE